MKIVKEFVLRTVAGESVLIPTGQTSQEFNGMITLSPTAAFIWEQLESSDSLDDLANRIIEEFDIDFETAKKDALGFVGEFVNAGYLIPTKEDLTW